LVLPILAVDKGESDRNGHITQGVQKDQRTEELIPEKIEGKDTKGGQCRAGEGYVDGGEDAKRPGPIDPRRFVQLEGDVKEELTQQEGAERAGQRWQDQGGMVIQQTKVL